MYCTKELSPIRWFAGLLFLCVASATACLPAAYLAGGAAGSVVAGKAMGSLSEQDLKVYDETIEKVHSEREGYGLVKVRAIFEWHTGPLASGAPVMDLRGLRYGILKFALLDAKGSTLQYVSAEGVELLRQDVVWDAVPVDEPIPIEFEVLVPTELWGQIEGAKHVQTWR